MGYDVFDIKSAISNFYDLKENAMELKNIVSLTSELTQSVPFSKNDRKAEEILILKLIFTTLSIVRLTEEIEYVSMKNGVRAKILDYPSIYVLTRSALENSQRYF